MAYVAAYKVSLDAGCKNQVHSVLQRLNMQVCPSGGELLDKCVGLKGKSRLLQYTSKNE